MEVVEIHEQWLNPDEGEWARIQTPSEFEDEALNIWKPSEEANELKLLAVELLQIAKAMKYLHDGHVIHRDLKPGNILIAPRLITSERYDDVKVADFGCAKPKAMKSSIEMVGTSLYRAPVLMNFTMNFTMNFDVYSFGVTCFEIMTGKVPFRSLQSAETAPHSYFTGLKMLTHPHLSVVNFMLWNERYSCDCPIVMELMSDDLSSLLANRKMWKPTDGAAVEAHPDPDLRECNPMFVHRLGDLGMEGITRPCAHNVLKQDWKLEEVDLNNVGDATGRDSMRQTDDAVSNQFAKEIQPPAHEKTTSKQEFFDNDYDSMSCDSWDSHGSQAKVTADSAFDEGDSKYATGKKRPRESRLEDDDSMMARLLPLLRRQVEEAVYSTLLPLVSALRSREENEQRHRERVLALEKEKVVLKREKFLFKRRRLARSQARTSTARPSTSTSGTRPRFNRHGLRLKHLAR